MTPLQMHLTKWKECHRCEYADRRRSIVLGKGDIPADIVFIGEAPGPSENMLGIPFIGKAGKLLDRIVYKAFGPPETRKYRIAFNNIVACIPLAEGEAHEKEEPDYECVMACKPRLEEFLELAQPRLIVAVGKTADEWLDPTFRDKVKLPKYLPPIVHIQHPASILRMPFAGQGLAEHKCVVTLTSAAQDHLEER